MGTSQWLWAVFAIILVLLVILAASVVSVRMFVGGKMSDEKEIAMSLIYGAKKVGKGKTMSRTATVGLPEIDFEGPEGYYVVAMYDPDAPDGAWRHWVVDNVPKIGSRLATEQGATLEPYVGPAPPAGTGQHRYVVAVYRRRGPSDALIIEPGRAKWSVSKFVSENGLALAESTYFVVNAPDAASAQP